ncbi:hypothetical protein [Microcoleus sp. EPA2]|uniref:hypothetical protein n=1 Tax=Microcoleus sp. EPA2 TaxID=2841654 RepID=UPI00312B9B56
MAVIEGRRKREEGRRKKEEGRRKKEEADFPQTISDGFFLTSSRFLFSLLSPPSSTTLDFFEIDRDYYSKQGENHVV